MTLDFIKVNGLIPAIIQDANTLKVLMLGYMNEEALLKTQKEGRVTFYSRSRTSIWTKGETSGNYLIVESIMNDCDNDALLIMATPTGPICHKGTDSCFNENNAKGFLYKLEKIIESKIAEGNNESYTSSLFNRGINKIAQKVGEEAVELIIEAKDNDESLFKNEAADLLFHFLLLLKAKKYSLEDIETILKKRNK